MITYLAAVNLKYKIMKSSFWLFGSKLSILEREENTESEFDLIEGLFLPASQSPVHVHSKYTETFYVLAGEVTIYTPGQATVLQVGETFLIPKNVPHSIGNNSDEEPFTALCITTPSGFAKLIRSVGFEVSDENPPERPHDMVLAAQICDEIGDIILGPPGARP